MTSWRLPVDRARLAARYSVGLVRSLRAPIAASEARQFVRAGLAGREEAFLDVFRRGMLEYEPSPYRALLRHAGVEYGDVASLARDEGVEGALGRLYEAGVYLTLEEFKGLSPIRRAGLELPVRAEDFDNPLTARVFRWRVGGSRGAPRSVFTNFDQLYRESAYLSLFETTFGLTGRPAAIWRPVPPSAAGLNAALMSAKVGRPLERWFSQDPLTLSRRTASDVLLTSYTVAASRLCGVALPRPEHVSLGDALPVARWLADKRSAGTPGWLNCPVSSGLRVCVAAREHGLDIDGSLFRLGGEPLTETRAAVFASTGSDVVCFYTVSDLGRIGLPCADPQAVDDVHVVSDQVAVLRRERAVGSDGARVGALVQTTLAASASRLMLNVESGDYGASIDRPCACPLGQLGLTQHVHTIRSYEKLTTEGATFLGPDLLTLLEETLPSRFGGRPTDYQLVEEEAEDGLARVSLVVSPSVGPVDEEALLRTAWDALGSGPRYRAMMSRLWSEGNAVRVVRREPSATHTGKVQPLHILRRPS